MNKDILKGKWQELKGKAKERWSDLTDDDLNLIEGKSDQLIGRLQQKYGWEKDRARKEVEDFTNRYAS